MLDGIAGSTGKSPNVDPSHPVSFNKKESENTELKEAMETPVHTLGQLKKVLISHLGEKKGMKLYNHFLTGLVSSMLSQIRQTQQSADQATKSMGQNQ